MYVLVGELALVGDHSTGPLTRISCNTVFSKSQKTRKAGTLCTGIPRLVRFFGPQQTALFEQGRADYPHLLQRVPKLRAFWDLEKTVLHGIRVSGTVLWSPINANSPTYMYISQKAC